jgi:FkbM family methyltransferase
MSMPEMRGVCRVAAQTSYLGNNTILCRVLSSYLLYGDTTDIGIVPHLAMNGCWEPALTMTMLHTLKQGWYCIDVGANHGYYSLLMASIVGKSGRVVAIEPNFKLAQLIRQSLTVNGFDAYASVLANAVSDKAGTIVKLAVPPGQTGHATIARPIMVDDEVMETETVTIDDLTADWGRVDYIKIDAEGAEEAIWRGMRQTLRKHRDITVILEFGMARYSDPKAFLQEILAEGFNLRYVDRDGAVKDLTLERCLTERTDRHWDLCLRRS